MVSAHLTLKKHSFALSLTLSVSLSLFFSLSFVHALSFVAGLKTKPVPLQQFLEKENR